MWQDEATTNTHWSEKMNSPPVNSVVLLGTSSAEADAHRNHVSLFAESENGKLLFDCGGAPSQTLLRYGSSPEEIDAVIVSHEHVDHLAGLPSLVHAKLLRSEGPVSLDLFGAESVLKTAETLLQAFGLVNGRVNLDINFHNLKSDDTQAKLKKHWALELIPTRHGKISSYAVLAYGSNKKLFYTSDCVLDDDLFEVIQSVSLDTIIIDCGGGLAQNESHSGLNTIEKYFGCDERIKLVHIQSRHLGLVQRHIQLNRLQYEVPPDGMRFIL